MNEKPDVCPMCGSERVAEIPYGLPDFSEELERALDAGEVVLGGCVVTGDDPSWRCVECGHRWSEWEHPNQGDGHDGDQKR
jgi:rubrerythrin